jgi:hypothetical protein
MVTVNVAVLPTHVIGGVEIEQLGLGLTTKVAWQVVGHPNSSVTVNS